MPNLDRLELEEVLEQTGSVKEEFRPHPGNVIAALIIGSIVVAIGVVIVVFVLSSDTLPAGTSPVVLSCGALTVFSGLASVLWSWHRSYYRFLVCEHGVLEISRRQMHAWKWEEIEMVEQYERPFDVSSSRRKSWNIKFRTGGDLKFDIQSVAGIERCMEVIREQTDKRGIPWHTSSSWLG
jgi:hypothetical protein